MTPDPNTPLEYGLGTPPRAPWRWPLLLGVWGVGLVVWLFYLVVLGFVLLVLL